jgi:hypothetical protein
MAKLPNLIYLYLFAALGAFPGSFAQASSPSTALAQLLEQEDKDFYKPPSPHPKGGPDGLE